MKEKTIVALLILFILGLVIWIIPASMPDPVVYLVTTAQNNDFTSQLKNGANIASMEHGIQLKILEIDDSLSIESQLDLDEPGNKAFVLSIPDTNLFLDIEKLIKQKLFPTITVHYSQPSQYISAFVGTNNVQASQSLGKAIIKSMDGQGSLGILASDQNSFFIRQRAESLKKFISDSSEIKVELVEYGNISEKISYENTLDIFRYNTQLSGIVALDSKIVVGAAKAIEELKYNTQLFGFDCTPEQIQLLENNTLIATAVESPYAMGYISIEYACFELMGKNSIRTTNTPVIIITKSNMFNSSTQKFIFPFN